MAKDEVFDEETLAAMDDASDGRGLFGPFRSNEEMWRALFGDEKPCEMFGTTLEEVESDVEKYEKGDFSGMVFGEPIDGKAEKKAMGNDELRRKFGVTGEQLDEWAAEYESGDWSRMEFGEVIKGRPRMAEEQDGDVEGR